MEFQTVAFIFAAVGVIWLFIETGGWIRRSLNLDSNRLFWPLWVFVWLTAILGAVCFDLC